MDTTVWKETRSALGVTAELAVLNRGGRIILVAAGGGFDCRVGPIEVEISGNGDREIQVGTCSGKAIYGSFRIQNWRRTDVFLSFDLGVWGRVGGGPWLPPGGSWFKVAGRLTAPASAAELGEYLQDGYLADLREHAIEVADEEPSAAAV